MSLSVDLCLLGGRHASALKDMPLYQDMGHQPREYLHGYTVGHYQARAKRLDRISKLRDEMGMLRGYMELAKTGEKWVFLAKRAGDLEKRIDNLWVKHHAMKECACLREPVL